MPLVQKHSLAIYGGPKIRQSPMPARRAFGNNEFRAIEELYNYYQRIGSDPCYQGRYEQMYCESFVRFMGVNGFADAVNSGTSALYVALAALELEPGSQVLVSPMTDPGTINAIILNQLVPVLADSSPNSYNVGVDEFKARISDKTKAAVIVHATGKPAPIDKIKELAKKRGIFLIEDCSQAHGARINGYRVGAFGDVSCFSTVYKKAHVTGGCGGVVFTQNKNLYYLMRAYADRGKHFGRDDYDDKNVTSYMFPAHNLNIDELSCAIGIKSLERLDENIQRRIVFLQNLSRMLFKKSKVCHLAPVSINDSPYFHPIIVEQSKISCPKNEFAKTVRAEGIDLNPHYEQIVCEWNWVKPYLFDDFQSQNTVDYRNSTFNLLFNENYGDQELNDIVEAILKVEEEFSV